LVPTGRPKARGVEQQAANAAAPACTIRAAAPQKIAAPVLAARELLFRRVAHRELQEQLLARGSRRQLLDADLASGLVDDHGWNVSRASETSTCSKAARCAAGAITSTCTGGPSRGSARSVVRYCASRRSRRARTAASASWRHVGSALQAGEAQPAILQIALAQAGAVGGDDKARPPLTPSRRSQRRREQRHGIHAREARAGFRQRIQPGGELLVLVKEASSRRSLRRSPLA
jgi:hypothetical protein